MPLATYAHGAQTGVAIKQKSAHKGKIGTVLLVCVLGGIGWFSWSDQDQESQPVTTPAKEVVATKPALKPVRPPSDTIIPKIQPLRKPVVPEQAPVEAPTQAVEETGYPEDNQSVWPVTMAGIDGAIGEVMPEIRSCYESWLLDYPDLSGRIKMKFTVVDEDGIGQVQKAEPTSTLGAAPFTACVTNLMANLQFDSPGDSGPVIIHYPFHFQNDDDGDD